ncbi:MSP (Major sperm protein) domain family protein [Brugia pahangi]
MSYIIVSPALIQVPCTGGFTNHTLECVGTDRLCFRVNPPMGFLRPGQKKQIVIERRAGKPGKTFLLVEYIAAPSGYDPRMPFVEGAEVGRVKIRVRAYKDEKIADTVLHLQGQTVTKHGQKFRSPAVIDDEKIEREIEALCAKNDMPQPMFEFDDHLTDIDETDAEEKKTDDDKLRQLHAKIHSPRKRSPSEPKKKAAITKNIDDGASSTSGGGSGISVGDKRGLSDSSSGRELIERIKGQVEKFPAEFETIKFLIIEQQRKVDEKLEKAISDLPYIKFTLILLIALFLVRISLI